MKKLWFIIAVIAYAGIGIMGVFGNAYTDQISRAEAMKKNFIFLIVVSIVIGGIFFYFFKKVFPKGYHNQNQVAKLLIPLLFVLLSFALTRAWVQFVNTLGPKERLVINGYIKDKKIDRGRRINFYYLIIADSSAGTQYNFQVKKSIFYQAEEGDKISKEFLNGSLGIIYRPDP